MKSEISYSLVVEGLEKSMRLDAYVASTIPELSRSQFSSSSEQICIDSKPAKASSQVSNDQTISFILHRDSFEGVIAQPIDFQVIYEDEDILVINKPRGLVVHPGSGNPDNTIVNGLAYRYGEGFVQRFEEDDYPFPRPGIVHRLDKETTGLMVIALNEVSHRDLSAQFGVRTTVKLYYAVVEQFLNPPKGELKTIHMRDPNNRKLFMAKTQAVYVTLGGHIQTKEMDDNGKLAWTEYETVEKKNTCSLVRLKIHTGRTHQIRVHMKSLGHPIIGDVLYNTKKYDVPMLLQAYHLEFNHPKTKKRMVFEIPLDQDLENYLGSN